MQLTGKTFGAASIAALGLALSAQGAFAQTNIQIYGIVDTGVEYIDGIASNGSDESLARVNGSNQVASRLGFRGTEDLGGGLKALFNLESGFATDTGASLQGGRLFGRGAVVGLQGGFGEVLIGRQRNTIFDLNLRYDPMAYATYGMTGHDLGFFTQRPDNSIKYTFKAGDLSSSLLYSFGRDGLAAGGTQSEVPGNTKIGRQIGANLNYAAGPVSVGFGFDQQNGTTAALASEHDRRYYLGASYVLGSTKFYGGYMRSDLEIVAPDQERDLYWVGVRHNLTNQLGVVASVQHSRLKDSPNKATTLGTSLYYDFSKRTQWYVNVGYADNSGQSTQGVTGNTAALPGENQTGVVTGIVHRF